MSTWFWYFTYIYKTENRRVDVFIDLYRTCTGFISSGVEKNWIGFNQEIKVFYIPLSI